MRTIYGELIRKQREEMGMSLSELSDRCLIKEKYLIKAETGEPVLSRADLVIICNVLDISSVALEEGRLMKKPGAAELEELIRKLEAKVGELQESIKEMKEAAAVLTGMEPEAMMEMSAAAGDTEKIPEVRAEQEMLEAAELNMEQAMPEAAELKPHRVVPEKTSEKAAEKSPEPDAVPNVPEKKEQAGPVL